MKKTFSTIILITILFALQTVAFADISPTNAMKAETFLASNKVNLPYRIYVPKSYSKTKEYSFLLFLHGAGNRGNDNKNQISVNTNIISRIINGETVTYDDKEINLSDEFIIIAPQCVSDYQWVDTPWGKTPEPSYSLS